MSWQGAYVGPFFGFGPKSTPSYIVAEIGRQVGPGMELYKVVSITATTRDVTLLVDCKEEDENKMEDMFMLLKGGGQVLNEWQLERVKGLGLLKE